MKELSIKFKEKHGGQVYIEANLEGKAELLSFIRGCITSKEEGDGPDTMVQEEDLERIYSTVDMQKEGLVMLKAADFFALINVADDWNIMVFNRVPPEKHNRYQVKKEMADVIYQMHQDSLT